MDKKKFYEAIDLIDDDLIREAGISPEKLAKADMDTDDGVTVSGVEVYSSKIKWRRIAAAAAVFAIAAGMGSAGYAMFRNRVPLPNEETEITTEETSEGMAAEVSTKESNDIKEEAVTTLKAKDNKEKSTVTSVAEEKNDAEKPTSAADNGEKPVQATETAAQQTGKPAETEKPKTTVITTAKTTTKATTKRTEPATTTVKTTKTVVDDPEGFNDFDIYESLKSLNYVPYTRDGLPEYVLNAPDGTIYYFNFSSGWVWRRLPDMDPATENEEGYLTKTQTAYLKRHGEEIGMYPSQYSVPVPMQNYDFNAKYVRTYYTGRNSGSPKKKIFTSRAELDSYVNEYKEKTGTMIGLGMNKTLEEEVAGYDDNWFSSNKLVMVILEEGSGSISHKVVQVGGINITIERIIPAVGTCDMAEWHILIELDKDLYLNNDVQISTYEKREQYNW